MSEMPDFEPTVPPVNEYPAPKKPRKKPTKKPKAAITTPKTRAKMLTAVKKRKIIKRRGRPAGVPNKPKVTQEVFLSDAVYKTIRTLVDLTASERDMVFSIVKGLTK